MDDWEGWALALALREVEEAARDSLAGAGMSALVAARDAFVDTLVAWRRARYAPLQAQGLAPVAIDFVAPPGPAGEEAALEPVDSQVARTVLWTYLDAVATIGICAGDGELGDPEAAASPTLSVVLSHYGGCAVDQVCALLEAGEAGAGVVIADPREALGVGQGYVAARLREVTPRERDALLLGAARAAQQACAYAMRVRRNSVLVWNCAVGGPEFFASVFEGALRHAYAVRSAQVAAEEEHVVLARLEEVVPAMPAVWCDSRLIAQSRGLHSELAARVGGEGARGEDG